MDGSPLIGVEACVRIGDVSLSLGGPAIEEPMASKDGDPRFGGAALAVSMY